MQITNKLATITKFEAQRPQFISQMDSREIKEFKFKQLPNNDFSLATQFYLYDISKDKTFTLTINAETVVDFDMNNEEINRDNLFTLYMNSLDMLRQEVEKERIKHQVIHEIVFYTLEGDNKEETLAALEIAFNKLNLDHLL